jgi:hypothetical protein
MYEAPFIGLWTFSSTPMPSFLGFSLISPLRLPTTSPLFSREIVNVGIRPVFWYPAFASHSKAVPPPFTPRRATGRARGSRRGRIMILMMIELEGWVPSGLLPGQLRPAGSPRQGQVMRNSVAQTVHLRDLPIVMPYLSPFVPEYIRITPTSRRARRTQP